MDFKQKIMTKTEQNAFIESMNLGKQQNLFFMEDLGASVQILAGLIGLIAVTCLCAYLLIYNIMHLSVAGKVRYYGLLQTIGMTETKIKRMMKEQMLLLGIALWGVGMGAQESILKAAVTSMVPKASRATGYGIFECSFGIFWFLGSWLLGVLYDVSVPAMVAVSVVSQLAAIPLYIASQKLHE